MEPDPKKLVQRGDIRTMKKDIQQMRGGFMKKSDGYERSIATQMEAPPIRTPQNTPFDQPPSEVPTPPPPPPQESKAPVYDKASSIIDNMPLDNNDFKYPAEEVPQQIKPSDIPLPAEHSQPEEKQYLKNVPPAIKEKLEASDQAEAAERKTFMEDVEKWASSPDKQSSGQ